MVRNLSTVILTLLFLGTMFGGLFHMSSGMDMSMSMGMGGCPFMNHDATLCSMSVTEHVESWKSAFLATTSWFTILLLALAAVVAILTIAPNLLSRQKWTESVISKRVFERIYTFSYRPFQELFSSGILHPKLF